VQRRGQNSDSEKEESKIFLKDISNVNNREEKIKKKNTQLMRK